MVVLTGVTPVPPVLTLLFVLAPLICTFKTSPSVHDNAKLVAPGHLSVVGPAAEVINMLLPDTSVPF